MTLSPDTAPPRPRARQTSASQRLVREIVRGLYDGSFAPGQRLVETDLMERFGLSRVTVREGLRRLEAEGVIETRPSRSAQIRNLSPAEAIDALAVIELCIGLAARQAAERIERADNRERFTTARDALLSFEAGGDVYDIAKASNRFHATIASISMNQELQRILPTMHVHLIRRRYSISAETRFEDYRQMAEAILSGDAARAEQFARRHIARTAELIRTRLE